MLQCEIIQRQLLALLRAYLTEQPPAAALDGGGFVLQLSVTSGV